MQHYLDGRVILNLCLEKSLKNGDEFLVHEILKGYLSNGIINSHLKYLRKLNCLFVVNNQKIKPRVQV